MPGFRSTSKTPAASGWWSPTRICRPCEARSTRDQPGSLTREFGVRSCAPECSRPRSLSHIPVLHDTCTSLCNGRSRTSDLQGRRKCKRIVGTILACASRHLHIPVQWPFSHIRVRHGTCTSLCNGRSRTSVCVTAPAHPCAMAAPSRQGARKPESSPKVTARPQRAQKNRGPRGFFDKSFAP
jgi:hypothetical protein